MSVAAKDGAWVSASRVVRLYCDKCGVVEVTRYPKNDREIDAMVMEHVRQKHGGRWDT